MSNLTVSNVLTNLTITPTHFKLLSISPTHSALLLALLSTDTCIIYEAAITEASLSQSNSSFGFERVLHKLLSSRHTIIVIDKDFWMKLTMVADGQLMEVEEVCSKLAARSNLETSGFTSTAAQVLICSQRDELSSQFQKLLLHYPNDDKKPIVAPLALCKHPSISVSQNTISNQSHHNQIRWVALSQPLSEYFKTKWAITIHKLDWLAVGIAHRNKLSSRQFQGLNGRSSHGCYVMDCCGWVHTAFPSIYNYQQIGFGFGAGDAVLLEVNALEKQLTVQLAARNLKLVLPLNMSQDLKNYSAVVGLNKGNTISYKFMD